MQKTPSNFIALSEESLDITGTAGGLQSIDNESSHALISFSGDDVFYSLVTAPTSTAGMLMTEGGFVLLETLQEMRDFQAILRTGGSAAKIYITYMGLERT